MTDYVVVVDDRGRETGVCEKIEAHRRGVKHRAFSVFVFDSRGRLLLQRRAAAKYHSGGLWTNTCCGHPRPGEETMAGARRRLMEEMAIDCELREMFQFSYRAAMSDTLTEDEIDHVFFGLSDAPPAPDPEEVSAWKHAECDAVQADLIRNPQDYTVWLRLCFEQVLRLRPALA